MLDSSQFQTNTSLRNDVWVFNYDGGDEDLYIVPDYQPDACNFSIGACGSEITSGFGNISQGHVYPLLLSSVGQYANNQPSTELHSHAVTDSSGSSVTAQVDVSINTSVDDYAVVVESAGGAALSVQTSDNNGLVDGSAVVITEQPSGGTVEVLSLIHI